MAVAVLRLLVHALGWPAIGLLWNGGVFLASNWSTGGELTFRPSRSITDAA